MILLDPMKTFNVALYILQEFRHNLFPHSMFKWTKMCVITDTSLRIAESTQTQTISWWDNLFFRSEEDSAYSIPLKNPFTRKVHAMSFPMVCYFLIESRNVEGNEFCIALYFLPNMTLMFYNYTIEHHQIYPRNMVLLSFFTSTATPVTVAVNGRHWTRKFYTNWEKNVLNNRIERELVQ